MFYVLLWKFVGLIKSGTGILPNIYLISLIIPGGWGDKIYLYALQNDEKEAKNSTNTSGLIT